MQPDDRTPSLNAGKLLAPLSVRLRLIAASAAILVVGGALAPAREDGVASRVEERANPLIEEQVTAAPAVASPFRGVEEAATQPRVHVVEIQPVARPAPLEHVVSDLPAEPPPGPMGAGVVVSDTYVLTHATALEGRLTVSITTAAGGAADATLAAHDPATGLVLLRGPSGLAPPAVLASAAPAAGSLTVAVGHANRRPIALPTFVALAGQSHLVVAPVGPSLAPGLPVFNLGGALVGVMGTPGSGDVMLAAGAVDRLIASAAAGGLPRSFGFAVQRLDGALAGVFGKRGVLISDVVSAGPAAVAGIVAGDVLLAVGEQDVATPRDAGDALAAAANAERATLRVLRRGRERTVTMTAASSFTTAHLVRLAAARQPAPTAAVVLPPPLLQSLGLSAQAQVLSVNGTAAITRTQADRALAGRRQVQVLHLRDEGGAFFVAVENGR